MFRTTGGKLGFMSPHGGYDMLFGNLTLKSWDTATSAFDITEAIDGFEVDGSGYANDTLTNDNNGNQTYDGTQAYTYDAWNRLISVAHASRDSGGTLHVGQVSSSTSYDALGRRLVKTVTGTGTGNGIGH
jgi:YD repeat-containing protein